MKKIIISCLVTAVLCCVATVIGAGYFVGNYAVHFGLERGTADDPQEPPRAYALLMPPEARTYTKPDYPSEEWTITSPDGLRLVQKDGFVAAELKIIGAFAHGGPHERIEPAHGRAERQK